MSLIYTIKSFIVEEIISKTSNESSKSNFLSLLFKIFKFCITRYIISFALCTFDLYFTLHFLSIQFNNRIVSLLYNCSISIKEAFNFSNIYMIYSSIIFLSYALYRKKSHKYSSVILSILNPGIRLISGINSNIYFSRNRILY